MGSQDGANRHWLFDGFERVSRRTARRSDPRFTYLNESARPGFSTARTTLEAWFGRYPEPHRADLRSRFRSQTDIQCLGAFFELLVHELLLQFDCTVEIHPELAQTAKRPDFLVREPTGEVFYLETSLVTDLSDQQRAEAAREARAIDAVASVESADFFVMVEILSVGPADLPVAVLRAFIEGRLAGITPGSLIGKPFIDAPEWRFQRDGWHIRFRPQTKTAEARQSTSILSISGSGEAHQVTVANSLRKKVLDKAGKYGDPGQPYVIAINSVADDSLDDSDVSECLFGDERCRITTDAKGIDVRDVRALNGAWFNGRPRHRENSAVLFFGHVLPWSLREGSVTLFHHPWAVRPMFSSCLTEFRQIKGDHETGRLVEVDGRSLLDLLSLPPDWPGHD